MYQNDELTKRLTELLSNQFLPRLSELTTQKEYRELVAQEEDISAQFKQTLPPEQFQMFLRYDSLKNNVAAMEGDVIAFYSSLTTVRLLKLLGVFA